MTDAARELPKYQCHKQVHALQIKDILENDQDGAATLTWVEEDYGPLRVDAIWMRRHNPQLGGYYVVYDDGYTSYSPPEAFAKGYTLIEET